MEQKSGLDRRTFLKSLAATVAVAPSAWTAPPASASGRAISALYKSLSESQRKEVCFDWDHRVDIVYGRVPLHIPATKGVLLRTHVSNAWLITPHKLAGSFYTNEQRGLVVEVLDAVLSPGWAKKLMQQAKDDTGKSWGESQALAFFGTPDSGRCQCVITGFHLTVRATSDPRSQAAFGGPISHGHQPSGFYEEVGHPGNIFWNQALLANDVFQKLDDLQRRKALVVEGIPFFTYGGAIDRSNVLPGDSWDRPREADIRFRGPGRRRPGLAVAKMGAEQKKALEQVLASLVEPYRKEYADQVYSCLKKQGGLDACSLAFYAEHDLGDDGQWDNWRLEGPAFVWYFRGSPHVHIWIHVADDPSAPISSYFG